MCSGQVAFSSLVLAFIMQPHLLHWPVSDIKNGHSLQIEYLSSAWISSTNSVFGFSMSQGRVSPRFFLYLSQAVSDILDLGNDNFWV